MKLSSFLVLAGLRISEAKDACVCKDTWSYPTDYSNGQCRGPVIGCPSTPCDDDSDGPWCVVKNEDCEGVQNYSEGFYYQTYYFASCSPASPTGTKIAPGHPGIRYIGRFDLTTPEVPRFAWPMSGFSVTFHGSQAVYGNFSFPAVGGRLRVIVDGETVGFVTQAGNSSLKQFLLADNLDSSKLHTLEVYKVAEGGDMTFGGFQLASGSFDSVPKPLARRLEFIGDSDTVGYCADGSPSFGSGQSQSGLSDTYVTWAQQLARSLGAEPMVEAVSGWGVTNSSNPIQNVLDYSVRFEPTTKWNYSQWTPDAVVILIGPNDGPTWGQSFINQYKNLLGMVATNYKNAFTPPKIIHVCAGSMNGFDPCSDIKTANEQFNTEQENSGSGIKGFSTSVTKDHWRMLNTGIWGQGNTLYNGCDSHYNEKGHYVVATDILPQVRAIMGWEDSIVV